MIKFIERLRDLTKIALSSSPESTQDVIIKQEINKAQYIINNIKERAEKAANSGKSELVVLRLKIGEGLDSDIPYKFSDKYDVPAEELGIKAKAVYNYIVSELRIIPVIVPRTAVNEFEIDQWYELIIKW